MPFTKSKKIAMAVRYIAMGSLRLAKMVPDVTENCDRQPAHLKILRVVRS